MERQISARCYIVNAAPVTGEMGSSNCSENAADWKLALCQENMILPRERNGGESEES